jgi:hypothetical protein
MSPEVATVPSRNNFAVTKNGRSGVFFLDRWDGACKIGEYLFIIMNKYS